MPTTMTVGKDSKLVLEWSGKGVNKKQSKLIPTAMFKVEVG